MRLSDLKKGQEAIITKILGHGAFRKRVMEMGFVRGREVRVDLKAPLSDPIKYHIMNYEVSLRRSEAALIEVEPIEAEKPRPDVRMSSGYGTITEASDIRDNDADPEVRANTINVALIGNPNCGKSSLFNDITGSHQHVGNYSGVTVDATKGECDFGGYHFHIYDLPGTYSLASYSPEEKYVRQYLRDQTPDVIINVVDASNLERNLYLTSELIDMDRSMVIALNMFDEIRREGSTIDYGTLGAMIGVPIVPTVSRTGEGKELLLKTVIEVFEGRNRDVRHIHVHLGPETEKAVTVLKDMIKRDGDIAHHISPRYIAIKLLEEDPETDRYIESVPDGDKILKQRDHELAVLRDIHQDEVATAIAAEKYGFIAGALEETMEKRENTTNTTAAIDRLVTNRIVGYPLFFAAMLMTFWLTFYVGQYPMEWIENGVTWLGAAVGRIMPEGPLRDMIADGIIGGVGGVIVFLPNILILYFCISFMEDTGYMARAAFIMDRVMHRIGLHGKSFIPLISGFGCNVPAIMGSRIIESKSSRLITILINPFMSCSARIPIYVLLIGTFFPGHAALVFLLMYVIGVCVAMVTARMLRRFWFGKDETPFVMELPPYRVPTVKAMWRHTWDKGREYLKKMGGIILLASIIVWALNYFPRHDASVPAGERQNSYLEMCGKFVAPVLEPLGLEWRASVAALAGVPAKEIVVSTLGVLYTGDSEASEQTLGERLREPDITTGKPDFTDATAISFMIFILLYCPCIATLAAIRRETGSWRYVAFSIVYNTSVAWLLAFAAYHLMLLL